MSRNRQIKEAKAAEIREKLEKVQAIVLAGYQGLVVEEDTALRKVLKEADVEYKVYKDSFITLAVKELGIEGLDSYLEGPVSITFGYEDAAAPARVLRIFTKGHGKLGLKAGTVERTLCNKEEVEKLAAIPSREVLITKLLGSFKVPLSDVTYLLNAARERKESESAG